MNIYPDHVYAGLGADEMCDLDFNGIVSDASDVVQDGGSYYLYGARNDATYVNCTVWTAFLPQRGYCHYYVTSGDGSTYTRIGFDVNHSDIFD